MKYRTGFLAQRCDDDSFDNWSLENMTIKDGYVVPIPATLKLADLKIFPNEDFPEQCKLSSGRNAYLIAKALSPEFGADFEFSSCIPSWNIQLKAAYWVEIELRVCCEGVWSKWYNMGRFSPHDSTLKRHSVINKVDEGISIATDTLNSEKLIQKWQTRLSFYKTVRSETHTETTISASDILFLDFGLTYSDKKPKASDIEVSKYSGKWPAMAVGTPKAVQMAYPIDGGVWCSPTSLSMLMGKWKADPDQNDERIYATVAGVYDHVYNGHGNWSFNAAYAGSKGYEAYVMRFTGLDQLEKFVREGIPVALSVAWNKESDNFVTNAPVSKTNGHLTTLYGFNADGNPIMHEPASATAEECERVYDRAELERCWLPVSGGVAYIVFPRLGNDSFIKYLGIINKK